MRVAQRQLDPRAKLALVVVVSILAVLIPRLDALAALALVMVIIVASGADITLREWVGLLAPFKVLVPIILILNSFFYSGGAVLWASDVFGLPLKLTTGGIEVSLVIAARLLVIAATAAWFAATTDAEAFEVALVRLGVPWTLAFVLSLTVRLVPELRARYRAVEEAQRSRGLIVKGGPLARARAHLPIFVPFFISVIRYGYDLGEALEVRGYGRADRRTYQLSLSFGRADSLLTVIAGVIFIGFAISFGVP